MLDHVYASFWVADSAPEELLGQILRFLVTMPQSASRPGFGELALRAMDAAEAPLIEKDLRDSGLGPLDVIEIIRPEFREDTACELDCFWDFGSYNAETGKWGTQAQRVEIACRGEQFDDSIAASNGHLQVDLGFEHLFTGEEDGEDWPGARSDSAIEMRRQNIKRLYAWVEDVTAKLDLAKYKLWSEGEENVEARLDEILARR
jgi:hypothetical protein